MYRSSSDALPLCGIMVASVLAGPVFVVTMIGAVAYQMLPAAIPINLAAKDVAILAALLVPTIIIGFILSIIPNVVGAAVMTRIGRAAPLARHPLAWMAVGAAKGTAFAVITGMTDETGPFAFALIATSAICARLCYRETAAPDEVKATVANVRLTPTKISNCPA